jgi:hypothetical protein
MRERDLVTRSIGDRLPAAVLALLDGADLGNRAGVTFMLITNNAEDWPHVAMLSVGELIAVDASVLRTGVWLTSSTVGNLSRTGRATLCFVVDGRAYSVHVRAERESDLDLDADGQLACFRLSVEDVLEDVAKYAELTSGVTFRLRSPADVVPRWERTVAALRNV